MTALNQPIPIRQREGGSGGRKVGEGGRFFSSVVLGKDSFTDVCEKMNLNTPHHLQFKTEPPLNIQVNIIKSLRKETHVKNLLTLR